MPLFDEDGNRIRGKKGKEAAEMALARVKVIGDEEADGTVNGRRLVAGVCSEYVQYCEQGVADGTVSAGHRNNTVSWLNDLCEYCGALPVAELKKGHVQKWIGRHKTWRSPATQRSVTRAERFDAVYFVDLPEVPQKQAIWRIYLDLFGLDPEQPCPADTDWSGAEIKACCRLAAMLDVPLAEAAENVVPVAKTACESIGKLRHWALGRCLSADRAGIYSREAKADTTKPRRKVRRPDPSNN